MLFEVYIPQKLLFTSYHVICFANVFLPFIFYYLYMAISRKCFLTIHSVSPNYIWQSIADVFLSFILYCLYMAIKCKCCRVMGHPKRMSSDINWRNKGYSHTLKFIFIIFIIYYLYPIDNAKIQKKLEVSIFNCFYCADYTIV